MKKRMLINFLYEENSKAIKINYVVSLPVIIILCLILLNIKLNSKVTKLETYIEENHKYTNVSNLDYNVDKNLIPITEIIEITRLINDSNIKQINISNNKLSLLGYSYDSNSIKSYLELLNKSGKTKNESIESINKEGEAYSFEIEANVGSTDEI